MDTERDLLVKTLMKDESALESAVKATMDTQRFLKPAWRSEEVRKAGNNLFLQKNHDAEIHWEIFDHYCKSISLAPMDSELLAQAYGNRSALLLHTHKYEECIKDIDRALGITKSDVLRVKLLCRKVECMKKLGLSNHQCVLDVAKSCIEKIDENEKNDVDKLIDKAKACSVGKRTIWQNQRAQDDILPKMDEALNCISIEHNEKYGRHLVSKKNYNPGDFIFSDKLYATVLNERMNYTHCNYCLKIAWSGIPCDQCSWAMFCSDECKNKAWDAFHDVECSVMFHLRNARLPLLDSMKVSLRLLLLGIREAGSIDKLRENLKLVDECKDTRHKGFYKNGKLTSCTIQSVYSLKSNGVSQHHLDEIASTALVVLIAVVKHSQLMKDSTFEKVADIIANEDLVFLGSLLIKLTAIKNINCHAFSQLTCLCKRLKSSGNVNECCQRGRCLTSLASLINHSCNPNTSMIFREDKTVVIYALQPIKKNTQIFITYAGFYHNTYLKDRKRKLEKYSFICKCRACIESWPPLFISPELAPVMPHGIETQLGNQCLNIFLALDNKQMNFSKEDIKKLCKTILKAKQLSKPSVLSADLGAALGEIYSRVYGWVPPIYAFAKCNKM